MKDSHDADEVVIGGIVDDIGLCRETTQSRTARLGRERANVGMIAQSFDGNIEPREHGIGRARVFREKELENVSDVFSRLRREGEFNGQVVLSTLP